VILAGDKRTVCTEVQQVAESSGRATPSLRSQRRKRVPRGLRCLGSLLKPKNPTLAHKPGKSGAARALHAEAFSYILPAGGKAKMEIPDERQARINAMEVS
jgi:hypothetical protein